MKVKINQTVLVRKRSNGSGRLERASDRVHTITRVYMNGNVQTETGDSWSIKPWNGKEADFVAVV